MRSCSQCNGPLVKLQEGSCGGRGTIMGCETCDITFSQKSGGMIPTPGGEVWNRYILRVSHFMAKPVKN